MSGPGLVLIRTECLGSALFIMTSFFEMSAIQVLRQKCPLFDFFTTNESDNSPVQFITFSFSSFQLSVSLFLTLERNFELELKLAHKPKPDRGDVHAVAWLHYSIHCNNNVIHNIFFQRYSQNKHIQTL